MVLIATTTAGYTLAFKVSLPVSAEDLERISELQAMPGLAGCTWTGRAGGDVR